MSFACPLTQSDADQRRGRLAVRGRSSPLSTWEVGRQNKTALRLPAKRMCLGGRYHHRPGVPALLGIPRSDDTEGQGPKESRGMATRRCASNQQGVAHALNVASPQLSRPGSFPAADSRFQAVPLAVPFRHPADGFSAGVLWGATTSTRPGAPLMCRFDFISERPISGLICRGR